MTDGDRPDAPAPPAGATGRRLPPAWRRAALATALLLATTAVLVLAAAGTIPAREGQPLPPDQGLTIVEPPPVDTSGLELLSTGLVRYDALWYLSIAEGWYPETDGVPQAAAFLPAYPGTVALVAGVVRDTLGAAWLVAIVATLLSFAGVHRLAELLVAEGTGGLDEELPGRAVLLLGLFPTSFFLLAPYSESLFLAATVWAMVHAARGRPVLAAAIAAVAGATRPVGALLALPLLLGVAGWSPLGPLARRDDRRVGDDGRRLGPFLVERLLPAAGAGLGLAAVLGYWWVRAGTPLAPLRAQAAWLRDWTLPTTTLADALGFALVQPAGGTPNGYHLLDVLVFALAATGIAVTLRRRQYALGVHAVVSVLVWTLQPFAQRPLLSVPRFALVVPAVVIGLAALARRPHAERVLLVVSGGLFAVHLTLFTRWWYVF